MQIHETTETSFALAVHDWLLLDTSAALLGEHHTSPADALTRQAASAKLSSSQGAALLRGELGSGSQGR